MKLLTSFAAKWVAKIPYLVGVITDSRQKSNFFIFPRSQVILYRLFLSCRRCRYCSCLLFFWVYFALQGHMARSHLDKQGKSSQFTTFSTQKLKLSTAKFWQTKYLPSLFYTTKLKKRETAKDERSIW